MRFNSRLVAFMLALAVCVVTIAFLSLLPTSTTTELFVAGLLSFSATFILHSVVFEYLIFREIREIYGSIDKINRKEFKSQSVEIVRDSSHPLRVVKGEIEAYANRKQKEIEELKKLELFRREFIADVSHELKTPLFAAQGFVLTLLDGAIDDENVRYKFLKKAARSLDGLSMLVQDLLTLTQIESGDITMHYEALDLPQLVADIFDQLEAKAQRRGTKLRLEAPADPPLLVKADHTRMGQVLTNLIGNAVKYGIEEGEVLVRLIPEGGQVLVSVADNGPGIAKEHLKRIFDRFYRIEKSRSRQQGGSGLGLAIVKHVLEKHQSPISVTSELGRGTTFSFKLQRAG
jgi:two-component system, OmpR family, phosphate regulon sensor histidine kinase PhoR